MASKTKPFLLLLLSLSTLSQFPTVKGDSETKHQKVLHVGTISSVLAGKGYKTMSLTLDMVLTTLVRNNNTAVTIFCPPDNAFISLKYPKPPFTLFQYHVAPTRLNKEVFESTVQHGSKIDTLLAGHPLVVTTVPDSGEASINDVKILDWDIYNDGHVIVHGVEDFFDPAFQTLQYPQYDGRVYGDKDSSCTSNKDSEGKGFVKEVYESSTLINVPKEKLSIPLLVISFIVVTLLLFAFFYLGSLYHKGDGYAYLQ